MITTACSERLHRCLQTSERFQDGLKLSLHQLALPVDGSGDFHAAAVASTPKLQESPISRATVGAMKRTAAVDGILHPAPATTTRAMLLSATFPVTTAGLRVTHALLSDAVNTPLAAFSMQVVFEEELDMDDRLFSLIEEDDNTKTKLASDAWRLGWQMFVTPLGAGAAVLLNQALLNTPLDPASWHLDATSAGGIATWEPTISSGSVTGRMTATERVTRADMVLGNAPPAGQVWSIAVRTGPGGAILHNFTAWPTSAMGDTASLDLSTVQETQASIWGPPAPSFSAARGESFSGSLPAIPGAVGDVTYGSSTDLPPPSWFDIKADGSYSGVAPNVAGRYYFGYTVSGGGLSGFADIADLASDAQKTGGVVTVT